MTNLKHVATDDDANKKASKAEKKLSPTLDELTSRAQILTATLSKHDTNIAAEQKVRAGVIKELRSITGQIVTLQLKNVSK